LVTTEACGAYSRNEPSLSSASATKISPLPLCALAPDSLSWPPIANDGSAPQCCSATVSSDVVVVLPWVPAIATARRPAMTEASAAALGSTRRPRRRASTSSGLVSRIAEDTTTVSASPTWPGAWPMCTVAPTARSAASARESLASLPETGRPRASRIRAMPDMPAPPMPTK
jgi:hypothetical protein